jgi:hypothetical protein
LHAEAKPCFEATRREVSPFHSMGSQQDIERYYFEQFRRASGLDVIPTYGDKPDVVLHIDRKIGVEITNFYIRPGAEEASEQRQRQRRQEVVDAAGESYRAAGGRRFELTIQFNPNRPIRSRRKAALIAELANLAAQIEGYPRGQVPSVLFEQSEELLTVWLNPRDYRDAAWYVSQVYSPDIVSSHRLLAIVREKETKACDYEPCAAYWLLVVVDLADPAQDQEICVGTLIVASSVFERVILFKPAFDEIVDVTII